MCIPIHGDARACPMHPECAPTIHPTGDVDHTCRTHTPNWRRFCTQTPCSDAHRRILRRWMRDVVPELAEDDVARMDDAALCERLERIDAEWRLPSTFPEHFDCTDEPDVISLGEFKDVPHEVLGTFVFTDGTPERAPRIKCADLRFVEAYARERAKQGLPPHVPHFQYLPDSPYLRERAREWEGRVRFYRDQFATEEALIAGPRMTDARLRVAVAQWRTDRPEALRRYGPIGEWNTADVTDMSALFRKWVDFDDPLDGWDTRRVTTMAKMFDYTDFNQPLHFDTGRVVDMSYMFSGAKRFNQPLRFNTANVTTMASMFYHSSEQKIARFHAHL